MNILKIFIYIKIIIIFINFKIIYKMFKNSESFNFNEKFLDKCLFSLDKVILTFNNLAI